MQINILVDHLEMWNFMQIDQQLVKGKLEPGVGNGRLLIPLLEKGLDIEAFDISNEMIQICRNNCEARNLQPNLFQEKMESFSSEVKYEAIIIPAGSFLLIHKGKILFKLYKTSMSI